MSNVYTHDRYNQVLLQTMRRCYELGKLKGGEYAGDHDRLANFRRNGNITGVPMETCWAIYYNKHHDAIMQFVHDLTTGNDRQRMEPLESRIDDMIVYLVLFKCMLDERNMGRPQAMAPEEARPKTSSEIVAEHLDELEKQFHSPRQR